MKAKTPPYVATAERLKSILSSEQAAAIAGLFIAPPDSIYNPDWFTENISKFAEGDSVAYYLLAYFLHEARPGKVQEFYTS